jgi:hypothetical protein
MKTFNADLATGAVLDYNFVVPNACSDGEANCKPVNNRYTRFDDFLAQEVPLIESSPAFGKDGVIVVTYDEDERMGGVAAKNGLGSAGTRCVRSSALSFGRASTPRPPTRTACSAQSRTDSDSGPISARPPRSGPSPSSGTEPFRTGLGGAGWMADARARTARGG